MINEAMEVVTNALHAIFDWFASIANSIGFDIPAFLVGMTIFLLAIRFFLSPAMRGGKSDKTQKKGGKNP